MKNLPKVYVASSLLNAKEAKDIMNWFKANGVAITYDWTTHGKLTDPKELKDGGEGEAKGVYDADLLFMKQPARTGAHVEMGIAIGINMMNSHLPIILVEDGNSEDKTFYYLDEYIYRFTDLTEALTKSLQLLGVKACSPYPFLMDKKDSG